MADVQIAPGVGNAPQTYEVPNATEIVPLAVNAVFDGTGAASAFVPTLEIISDGGVVIARVPCATTVQAGASAEVTFAPFLGQAASTTVGGLALLGRVQLGADAPSVTFSGIAQTHTHMELYSLARTDRAAGSDLIALQFNGDNGAHYDWEQLFGNSGTSDAFNAPLGGHIGGPITNIALTSATGDTATAGRFGTARVTVPFYSTTTAPKIVIGEGGVFVDDSAVGAVRASMSGIWTNTAAITSILLFPAVGTNFRAGSTFELYGI